jgi:hypothetical protein
VVGDEPLLLRRRPQVILAGGAVILTLVLTLLAWFCSVTCAVRDMYCITGDVLVSPYSPTTVLGFCFQLTLAGGGER